jgi:hypothetical protein
MLPLFCRGWLCAIAAKEAVIKIEIDHNIIIFIVFMSLLLLFYPFIIGDKYI